MDLQIAELVATSVIDGSYPEETQVPSSNELAAFHRINPATAAKGLNEPVERRRDEFARQYVAGGALFTRGGRLGSWTAIIGTALAVTVVVLDGVGFLLVRRATP